jgi:diguanylate cyclase (GGDEF)-like protein
VNCARAVSSASAAVSLLYFAPSLGWWTLALFGLSAANLQTLDRRMRRSHVPEYHAAFSILWSQCIVGAAIALSGGSRSPGLALVLVPTVFSGTRFPARVVWLAAASAITVLLAATFGTDVGATIAHPAALIITLAVVIGVSATVRAMSEAELEIRDTAILDPLTGLLNRQGLERRFAELAEQARLTGEPISVLMCDLDHFKAVNDSRGHAVGDAVLRDVAYELRTQLRSFELIYRMGGEEFFVVLPGAPPSDARALAERLCEGVRRCRPQGVVLTASIGVSTRWGADAQFTTLFDFADRALYRAKAAGRDRVVEDTLRTGAAWDIEVAARLAAMTRAGVT